MPRKKKTQLDIIKSEIRSEKKSTEQKESSKPTENELTLDYIGSSTLKNYPINYLKLVTNPNEKYYIDKYLRHLTILEKEYKQLLKEIDTLTINIKKWEELIITKNVQQENVKQKIKTAENKIIEFKDKKENMTPLAYKKGIKELNENLENLNNILDELKNQSIELNNKIKDANNTLIKLNKQIQH